MERLSAAADDGTVQLYPRRKSGKCAEPPARGRPPMLLCYRTIASHFGGPQTDAAQRLGISLTTLKQACRKLGISRWPYMRPSKAAAARRMRAGAKVAHDTQAQAEDSDNPYNSDFSTEAVHAGKNDDGLAAYTHRRYPNDPIPPPSKTLHASNEKAQDTAVVAGATCDFEKNENEHDPTMEGTDLGWLMMSERDDEETALWSQPQRRSCPFAAAERGASPARGRALPVSWGCVDTTEEQHDDGKIQTETHIRR